MAYTKAKIYNLALGALLLNKKISDVDTDTSVENQTLTVHYELAFSSTISDLDLDATSTQKALELIIADPNDLWAYAYKYPSDCSMFRRIQNQVLKDNRTTQILRKIGTYNGQKVIFTNQDAAIGEYVSNTLSLSTLSDAAGLAVAYKLAMLSAPLISGKGAGPLRKEIEAKYLVAKAEAQEHDRMENANFDEDSVMSDFVEARTS